MKERELDLTVSDHAAHWLLRPVTEKGQAWCKRELGEDVHMWRGSYIIPNPLIFSVFHAIVDDRLELDYRSAEVCGRGSWFQKRAGKPENEAKLPLRPSLSR